MKNFCIILITFFISFTLTHSQTVKYGTDSDHSDIVVYGNDILSWHSDWWTRGEYNSETGVFNRNVIEKEESTRITCDDNTITWARFGGTTEFILINKYEFGEDTITYMLMNTDDSNYYALVLYQRQGVLRLMPADTPYTYMYEMRISGYTVLYREDEE